MFRKYQLLLVCLFLPAYSALLAQETGTPPPPPPEAGVPEPVKMETKKEKQKKKPKEKTEEAAPEADLEKKEPTFKDKLAEHLKTRLVLHTGVGGAKAFKKKANLRANGFSDFKISYRLPKPVLEKEIFVTFRYLPISIAPKGETSDYQEFKGVVEAYQFGLETGFELHRSFEVLPSVEVGLVHSHLRPQIPVVDDAAPLKKFGGSFSIGIEGRWKGWDFFHLGPRLHISFGNITVLQFLASASFYF